MTEYRVHVERYDHQGKVADWPAMRGQVFSAGRYAGFVSDVGHVSFEEVVGGQDSAASLVEARELLAVLTAAVAAAEASTAAYTARMARAEDLQAAETWAIIQDRRGEDDLLRGYYGLRAAAHDGHQTDVDRLRDAEDTLIAAWSKDVDGA